MKYLVLMILVIGCDNSPKITDFKNGESNHILSFDRTHAPAGSLNKLLIHAQSICPKFKLLSELGSDRYGDVKGISIECLNKP